MPMIDLYAPQGALPADALRALAARIVTVVLADEGYAGSRFAGSVCWTYVHEVPPGCLLVGEEPCHAAVWRVEVATPIGSLEGAAKLRPGMEIARLVLATEGVAFSSSEASRVWCIFRDVAEGEWLAGERITTAAGIRAAVAHEREAASA